MDNFLLSEFDFLEIQFENFERIRFSTDFISKLEINHLIVNESNSQYKTNSYELIILPDGNSNALADENFICNDYNSFKRIYQQSDICYISLIKGDKVFVIQCIWDDSDAYNYQTNFWQHVEFLNDKSLRIVSDPSIEKDIISKRVDQFSFSEYRNHFDMAFLNSAISDLETSLDSTIAASSPEFITKYTEEFLEKVKSFVKNQCFEYEQNLPNSNKL